MNATSSHRGPTITIAFALATALHAIIGLFLIFQQTLAYSNSAPKFHFTALSNHEASSSNVDTAMLPHSSFPILRILRYSRGWHLRSTKASHTDVHDNRPTITPISFYNFRNYTAEELEIIRQDAYNLLHNAGIQGTLLLAREGYNAQMAVPTALLQQIHDSLAPILREPRIHFNRGTQFVEDTLKPFRKLMVRIKPKVLTDHLGDDIQIDWTAAGPELAPADWHRDILAASDGTQPALVLDCRNDYESQMGTFVGAEPLNTSKFSETWEVLEERLKGVSKDTKVMTFCTGGIRCVKVNAYIKQKLGFQNVYRLERGIIAYDSWFNEQQQRLGQGTEGIADGHIQADTTVASSDTETPLATDALVSRKAFVGKNFLFDRRRLEE